MAEGERSADEAASAAGQLAGDSVSAPESEAAPVDEVSTDTDVFPIELLPVPRIPPPPVPSGPPPGYVQQGYPPPGYPPQGYQYPQGYAPQGYQQPGYQPPGSPARGYQQLGYQQLANSRQPYPPLAYPPQYYPGYQPYARRGGTSLRLKVFLTLLFLVLVGLVTLIAAIAGGVFSYNDLVRLVGMGPGEVYVQNLRDDAVTVVVEQLDSEGTVVRSYNDNLGAADVRAYPNRDNGPWDIRFAAADGSNLGTCHLTIAGNGRYTFMVLPEIVVVSRAGASVADGDELVVATSSLCQR